MAQLNQRIAKTETRLNSSVASLRNEMNSRSKEIGEVKKTLQTMGTTAQQQARTLTSVQSGLNTISKTTNEQIKPFIRDIVAARGLQDYIMSRGLEKLVEWTAKKKTTVIYDSAVDDFTHDRFFEKVKNKGSVAVIGFTSDGDVFGGFYKDPLVEKGKHLKQSDMFIFSFESHGRCPTPKQFRVLEDLKPHLWVRSYGDEGTSGFIHFQSDEVNGHEKAGFFLGNERSNSYCLNMSKGFQDIEDTTLTGRNGMSFSQCHHCLRVVAVHVS